jgi:hypothetical protein
LEKTALTYCPVCFEVLPTISPHWTQVDILWHLHNCQHKGALSTTDHDNFKTLVSRWNGRVQAVYRIFSMKTAPMIGPRKEWTHREHKRSYRAKIKEGRDNATGLYLAKPSKLQVHSAHGESEVRSVRQNKSVRPVWGNIEAFRRNSYSVYTRPSGEEL